MKELTHQEMIDKGSIVNDDSGLNTRPNDAKIDDKLFMECFDKWVPDIDEMEQPADIDNDDVYAWCRNVLNMYLGIVCKQSREGEE